MNERTAARIGWGAFGLSLVCGAVAAVWIAAHQSEPLSDWLDTTTQELVVGMAAIVGFGLFGALIVSRHPRNPIGWLFCAAALAAGINGVAREWATEALVVDPGSLPAGEFMAWLGSWTWILFVPVPGTIVLLLFPTGHLPSPRWRLALWFAIAVNVGLLLGFGFSDGELEGYGIENPVGFLPEGIMGLGVLLLPAVGLGFASLIVRYRASEGEERQQLRWMAAAAALYLVAMAAEFILALITGDWQGWPTLLATFAVIVSAGVAVLRYRLYDLDLVVNRTIVYGLLTALVVAGYVGLVAGLGELLDSTGIGVSLLATAVVAVAIQPLRAVIQGRVDRVMYGDRHDPYAALSRLGARLGQTLDPDEVLPATVAAVAEGLRLPYAAIELDEETGPRLAAVHGQVPAEDPVRLRLEYRGERVGSLLAGVRTGSDALSSADMRLLGDLARQAGVAVHAVRLTQDLRRSRERLVAAREEERRRLRRDLHDGLGPDVRGDRARDRVGAGPGASGILARARTSSPGSRARCRTRSGRSAGSPTTFVRRRSTSLGWSPRSASRRPASVPTGVRRRQRPVSRSMLRPSCRRSRPRSRSPRTGSRSRR